MSEAGHNSEGIARDQLRAFVERIERLEEEGRAISDDKRDVYAEARGTGVDVKALKKVIAIRRKDPQQHQEEEAVVDTYMIALGMIGDDNDE